jgi:hypothetical protein
VDLLVSTNVTEEHTASIFRTEYVVSMKIKMTMGKKGNNFMEHTMRSSVKCVPFIAERCMSDGCGS